jgi:excisionase family DNA binding protein
MEDRFLTVAEVADMLRVNQQSVRNWLDRGELSGVRVGKRRVRIRQSDLDAFIALGEMRSEPDASPDLFGPDREELAVSLDEVRTQLLARDDRDLAEALRSVARAASRLATALERQRGA